jgi:inosine-uridine nucleoside N-ribohydrolase
MPTQTLILTDPGIDTTFALGLALYDPDVEVLGLAATAGNVKADRATATLHALIELLDPPRWPRFGAALSVEYDRDATDVHGPDGLGGLNLPDVRPHHATPADKLLCEMARERSGDLTLLVLGPLTTLARALDRDAELARNLERIIILAGAWREPGDVSQVVEFHFACDPEAARQVLHCGAPLTLVPLDVSRKLIFSPGDLRLFDEAADTALVNLLRRVVPSALAPTAGRYGVEGVYLDAVVGLAALVKPEVFGIRAVPAEVETRGELTRGMSVFDVRWAAPNRPNIDLVTDVDVTAVRKYVVRTLSQRPDRA